MPLSYAKSSVQLQTVQPPAHYAHLLISSWCRAQCPACIPAQMALTVPAIIHGICSGRIARQRPDHVAARHDQHRLALRHQRHRTPRHRLGATRLPRFVMAAGPLRARRGTQLCQSGADRHAVQPVPPRQHHRAGHELLVPRSLQPADESAVARFRAHAYFLQLHRRRPFDLPQRRRD